MINLMKRRNSQFYTSVSQVMTGCEEYLLREGPRGLQFGTIIILYRYSLAKYHPESRKRNRK